MPTLIPCYANSFQISMNMPTKEVHIRYLALTPRVSQDTTKPSELDAFEVASIFMSEGAARALCKNLEQSLEDFNKYDSDVTDAGEIDV